MCGLLFKLSLYSTHYLESFKPVPLIIFWKSIAGTQLSFLSESRLPDSIPQLFTPHFPTLPLPQSGKGAQRIQHASIQRHCCIVVVGFQGPPAGDVTNTGCENTSTLRCHQPWLGNSL